MKLKCIFVPYFWDDLLTLNKSYVVEEASESEYWVVDDNGDYTEIPKDFFQNKK